MRCGGEERREKRRPGEVTWEVEKLRGEERRNTDSEVRRMTKRRRKARRGEAKRGGEKIGENDVRKNDRGEECRVEAKKMTKT